MAESERENPLEDLGNLTGLFLRRVDAQKRVALPAPLRRELGERVRITQWFDNSLALYDRLHWPNVVAELAQEEMKGLTAREIRRLIHARSIGATLDIQGRVRLLDSYFHYANLSVEEEVIVLGNDNIVELWNVNNWDNYQRRTAAKGKGSSRLLPSFIRSSLSVVTAAS